MERYYGKVLCIKCKLKFEPVARGSQLPRFENGNHKIPCPQCGKDVEFRVENITTFVTLDTGIDKVSEIS